MPQGGLNRFLYEATFHVVNLGDSAKVRAHKAMNERIRVARLLSNWRRAADRFGGMSMRRVEVNGQPGALVLDAEDRLISVIALDIADGQVQGVRSIVNPDKLDHLGPVADLRGLLERASQARRTSS